MAKKVGWIRTKSLKFQTKKFRPNSIGNWQPLKDFKKMDLGRCKIRIGSKKSSQKTLLLSKNIWKQSKWSEMGALTRAVAVRWEERREHIRKYCRKMKGLSHLSEGRKNKSRLDCR